MSLKNLLDLERLNCIEMCKTVSVGFDLKKVLFKIKNTDFFIQSEYWKGDNFYAYDTSCIKIVDADSIRFGNDLHKCKKWNIEDSLKLMPKDVQLEILMNLDLFTRI